MSFVIPDANEPSSTATVVGFDDHARRAILEFASGERRAILPPDRVEVSIGMKVHVLDSGDGSLTVSWDVAPAV